VLALGLLTDNNCEAIRWSQGPLLSLGQGRRVAQVALVLVLFFGGLTTQTGPGSSHRQPATAWPPRLPDHGFVVDCGGLAFRSLAGQPSSHQPAPGLFFVLGPCLQPYRRAVMATLRRSSGHLPPAAGPVEMDRL